MNSGVGEHVIIKGGSRFATEYLIRNSLDVDKSTFLKNLYYLDHNEQILEFGFISICNFKGTSV